MFIDLDIILSLSLMGVEAQSDAPYHIKQTSNLFKRMGCGYNPKAVTGARKPLGDASW